MTTEKRLIVAGCSVSDYSGGVSTTYGKVLSELASMHYIDESAECGSNFRTWRRITTMIRTGEIGRDDLLVIQYTTPERKEFYSHYETSKRTDDRSNKAKPLREPYDDGSTIKFKYHSHDFYQYQEEKEFLRSLQEGFTSVTYDTEVFMNFQYMFQFMLKDIGIKTLFLRESHYQPSFIEKIECDTQIYYNIDDYFSEGLAFLSNNLYGHLNDSGHRKLGTDLFNYLSDKNFI